MELDYTYDPNGDPTKNNGNVQTQQIIGGGLNVLQTYGYDTVNRLTSASESGGSWSQGYGYDQYGNRWLSSFAVITPSPLTPQSQSAFNSTTNRILACTYDLSGNQIADAQGRQFAYDGERRQVRFNNGAAIYSYDGDGRRVMKVDSTGTTVFVHNVTGQLIAEYSTATPQQGGTSYLTTDHLGSTRVVINVQNGVATLSARRDYLPFGEDINAGVGGRTAGMMYSSNDDTRQRFTGKEHDGESQLDYFGARYYSSAQGRFTSPDEPLVDQRPSDPQSWNLFAYVSNNPLIYIDPLGLWKQTAAGVWEWEEGDTWQSLSDLIHVTVGRLKKAFKGAELGQGLVLDTNNLSVGSPQQIYADPWTTPLAKGVASEMNRREAASLHAIEIIGAVNLAPAVLASATLSGGTITTLGVAGGPVTGTLQGAIIGWGTGQSAAAVAQTQQVTAYLTATRVTSLIARGLSKEWVEGQLTMYLAKIAAGGAGLNNTQLFARKECMEKILSLRPK